MSWQTITDDREKYKAYLCSREWALLRNDVRERCGGKCERCKVNDMECVHHLTYARKYNERIDDLSGWCNACHDFTHGKSNNDPLQILHMKPRGWEDIANRVFFGDLGEGTDRDDFIRFFEKEISRSCNCGRCGFGTPTWAKMLVTYAMASQIIEKMGLLWFVMASEGDFAENDPSTDDLAAETSPKRLS